LIARYVAAIKRGVVFDYLIEEVQRGKFKMFISAIALAEVYKKKRFLTPHPKELDEFILLVEKSLLR